MENPNPVPTRPCEPELDLYTIPSYSSWFTWDDIHETERSALKEFFDGRSITRTPKVYKEYRDFIINKFREDSSRRLTFTEIRKSLIGDVNLIHKVFRFLERWGLINFGVVSSRDDDPDSDESGNVRVEDGAPNGVRVVTTPNSLKPLWVPRRHVGDVVENGVKLPPLASYSDVYSDLAKPKRFLCGSCGENCDSGRYEDDKGGYVICVKCYKDGNFGENKSKDDFKFIDSSSKEAGWTEAEILLLLESVLKHGDNWDLVAQSVQTKTKLDCISKLIELPFGDFLLTSVTGRGNSGVLSGKINGTEQVPLSPPDHLQEVKSEGELHENTDETEQNGDLVTEAHPSKRQCVASVSDGGSSLMKQVALISTLVDHDISAAAADAAVAALCNETSFPRDIFDGEVDFPTNRPCPYEDSEMKERPAHADTTETSQMQDDVPLTLRLRAAVATALGSAAARAKLLADQEDREIENLMAVILETQLKKLKYKVKHFDDLEVIMEKEYAELEELKESLIDERIDVIQRAITSGIPKWRDYSGAKPYSGS
ncbi:hypothetical protein K2173_027601 [Erythroxylum novogranatense]|uniref:SWI/SNF complex subunit SWI3A n=1 Tax=Erythroxylum novogranatense TaxID=1862640 RepID=A0AAV8U2R4_9ROSI|nr:hypothetical protein K2173_027601 [Erythroxylum novogranatense]